MAAGVRQSPGRGGEPGEGGTRQRPRFQAPSSAKGLHRLLRAARPDQHVPGLPGPARHSILHSGLPPLANTSEQRAGSVALSSALTHRRGMDFTSSEIGRVPMSRRRRSRLLGRDPQDAVFVDLLRFARNPRSVWECRLDGVFVLGKVTSESANGDLPTNRPTADRGRSNGRLCR